MEGRFLLGTMAGGMLTFLFWNIRGNNLTENINRLVKQNSVDIVILAEAQNIPSLRTDLLTKLTNFHYLSDSPDCPRIQIYTRFSSALLLPIGENDRYRAHAIELVDGRKLLFFACHFISLQNRDDYTLNAEARSHAREFREIEANDSNRFSVVVGDLNLNPFAPGIAYEDGFCALMSKTQAQSRDQNGRVSFKPFYNPMWSHLGDASPGPPGSYYYAGSGGTSRYFWHTFDQVLLRPGLLSTWKDEYLIRPTDDGVINFLTKTGIPDKTISDHLPLIFRLDLDIKL